MSSSAGNDDDRSRREEFLSRLEAQQHQHQQQQQQDRPVNIESVPSDAERNQLQAYLERCNTTLDSMSFRLEDLDESSLICLLQCIRGKCDFAHIGDLFSSRFTSEQATPVANTPTTAKAATSPIPSEVWQRQVMEKLEQQQEAILKCQAQMDALAQLMTALLADSTNSRQATGTRPTSLSPNNNPLTSQNHRSTLLHTSPPSAPKRVVFSFLETFISIPREITTHIASLRLVRFIRQLQTEALRENVQWIHFPLLFKMFFACFIFSSRMKAFDTVTAHSMVDGLFLSFWKQYRIYIFAIFSVAIYFVKTGIASLWYKVLMQEDLLGRIWRDEDLNENTHQFSSHDGSNERIDHSFRRGQRDRNDGNEVRRENGIIRGGRVEMTHNDPGENDQDTADPHLDPDHSAQRRNDDLQRNNVARLFEEIVHLPIQQWRVFSLTQLRQGFLGGNIRRRNHGGRGQDPRGHLMQLYKEILADFVYLIGSFFLSLFPMWQPRAQQETEYPIANNE